MNQAKDRASRTALKLERNLRQEIARLREQLDSSIRELGITPAAAERVVSTALALAHQPPLRRVGAKPGCYQVGQLAHAWSRAKIGLQDPLTAIERPITFDHKIASRDRDVVLAHLGHRLVVQATRLLRAEIWKTGGEKTLSRVSACMATMGEVRETAVVAHARVVITGADGHRLHEEVIAAGGLVRNGRFSRMKTGEVRNALEAASEETAPPSARRRLIAEWAVIETPLYRALEARSDEIVAGLERRLQERADSDVRSIEAVLTELKRSIESQLAEFEGETGRQLRLEFATDEERTQFERDLDGLRARLRQIPAEIIRERDAIRRRYQAPQARLFPAAVTVVVPRS